MTQSGTKPATKNPGALPVSYVVAKVLWSVCTVL